MALCPSIQLTDAIGVIGFVGQHYGVGTKMVEQGVCDLSVMCLPGSQFEPDREPLRINDRMDFGGETASGTTETIISIPLFAVAAC